MQSIGFCNQVACSCKKSSKKENIISIQENIFNKYINLIIQALEDGTFPLGGDFYKNHTISESDIVIIKKFLEEMKEYCKNKKNAP